ncbi:uncharacterized protein LOC101894096 [Musca domestica]|uniref:Uncharacterized protein LOC101894096 n=1 Tax=Musca domestica TaxID=7370 RepID=A0A1I8N800_MUSDO|nr:uncharacterized protein LOC101894096 [Musca domestica]
MSSNNTSIYLAYVFIAVICLSIASLSAQERNYIIELTKVRCYQNSTHFKALQCSLRNESNIRVLDIRMELTTTIRDFQIHSVMKGYRPKMPTLTIYDVNLSACDFLANLNRLRLFITLLKSFKRYYNADAKCPFRKNFNYTLIGFKFDTSLYPSYLPEGVFTAVNSVKYENKSIAKTMFWGRVAYIK